MGLSESHEDIDSNETTQPRRVAMRRKSIVRGRLVNQRRGHLPSESCWISWSVGSISTASRSGASLNYRKTKIFERENYCWVGHVWTDVYKDRKYIKGDGVYRDALLGSCLSQRVTYVITKLGVRHVTLETQHGDEVVCDQLTRFVQHAFTQLTSEALEITRAIRQRYLATFEGQIEMSVAAEEIERVHQPVNGSWAKLLERAPGIFFEVTIPLVNNWITAPLQAKQIQGNTVDDGQC